MLSPALRESIETELRSAWVNADQVASLVKQAQAALRDGNLVSLRVLLEQATQPAEFAACHVRWAKDKVID